MKIYVLKEKWTSDHYWCLLEAAKRFNGYCVLVIRGSHTKAATNIIENFNEWLVKGKQGQIWPGTVLLDGNNAFIFKFRITEEFLRRLKDMSNTPWDWIGPNRPEDLSFLRNNGTPWFISITHERDAYFKLSSEEKIQIDNIKCFGELVYQGESENPNECYL